MKSKLAVYRAAVLPTLLYGCETWTTYRRHIKQLDQFQLTSPRGIMGIPWEDRVPNSEVPRQAELPDTEALIIEPSTGKTECQTPRSSDKQSFLTPRH